MNYNSDILQSEIANIANICFKPFKHNVLIERNNLCNSVIVEDKELIVLVKCRDIDGNRQKYRDIEVEIFKSSNEISIIVLFSNLANDPILWYGKDPVWMDAFNGKRCAVPKNHIEFESFAKRIKSNFNCFFMD